MEAVIFAEEALAPTATLWSDAVAHIARKLGRVKPLDTGTLPADRRATVAALAEWAGSEVSSWETELGRFFEDHIPIYVRPSPALAATVRRLEREGVRLGAWSAGPPPCAEVVVHYLGLARRLERCQVEPLLDASAHLAAQLTDDPAAVLAVSGDPAEIAAARAAGLRTAAALWARGAEKAALLTELPTYLAAAPDDLVPLALDGRMPVGR
jgi:phosphoglycolate phosphatase-like HAD superfamily hydrolase